MTRLRRSMVVGAVSGSMVALVGCGSSRLAANTTTTVSTTTTTVLATTTSPVATFPPATVAVATSTTPVPTVATTVAPTTTPTTVLATTTTAAPIPGRGLTAVVSAVAGNGATDGSGVPGPAADASLGAKVQFAVSSNGDIYVTNDSLNVYRISGGQVTVFGQLDPNGGPGSGGVAVAPDGSVYVATSTTVRKFSADGQSTVVLLTNPAGLSSSLGPIVVDAAGNLFVADGSRRVTRVAPDGSTSTVAGTGTQAPPNSAAGDGGPGASSPLGAPVQLAVDGAGGVLIADVSAHRVRRVAPDGTISTIAGGGAAPVSPVAELYVGDGTAPTDLQLGQISGVAVDSAGRVYVADAQNHVIFRFGATGGIQIVIGDQKGGSSAAGLPANETRVTNVGPLAVDSHGNLLYLESSVIRAITGAAT